MKKPNPKNLRENKSETARLRAKANTAKKVKITINIEAETLTRYRKIAEDTGIPYQRLINRKLMENLEEEESIHERLTKVEKELRALKKKLSA